MCGVGATGEVALVTDHGVFGAGPSESRDHPVGELVGEKMRWHGSASGWAGQTGGPEGTVTGRGHPTYPDPAQIVGPPIALRLEPGDDRWVLEPGPPAALRNADWSRLSDQHQLLGPRGVGAAGKPVQRKRTSRDRRHPLPFSRLIWLLPARVSACSEKDVLFTRTPTFAPAVTGCARRCTRRYPERPVRPIASLW
jgi:hypothetical protein